MDEKKTGNADVNIEKSAPPKEAPAEKAKTPNSSGFLASSLWQTILYPMIALVIICAVTSMLLGLTNEATINTIEANNARAASEARRTLLPEADDFTQVDNSGLPENVTAVFKANNGTGWVVESWGRGYGGKVPAMVAFDAAGTIIGVKFLENTETPGLGQNVVTKTEFAQQFHGMGESNVELAEIDKLASSTITTKAALQAVNAAIEAYEIKANGAAAPNLEEVALALLPGETLTAIGLDAQGIHPDIWRSDSGKFVIVGTSATGNGQTTLAAVAMDDQGAILGVWADTPGTPELAGDKAFLDSFKGISAPAVVEAVSGLEDASRTVMDAVNMALSALPLAKEAV